MFVVLHFNLPGERAALQDTCHAHFKKYKNVSFLELNSLCWLRARTSKMCRNVMAQSMLRNDRGQQEYACLNI